MNLFILEEYEYWTLHCPLMYGLLLQSLAHDYRNKVSSFNFREKFRQGRSNVIVKIGGELHDSDMTNELFSHSDKV